VSFIRQDGGVTVTELASIPSPAQGVWYLGPLPVRAYALFIVAGIFVAAWIGNRRWVARGGRAGIVAEVSFWAVPFGIVGGRIYHVITDNQLYFGEGRNPWNAFAIWNGGLGIWGAIALGAVGAWIGCRRQGVPLSAYADCLAPGLLVAQAMGRLGNYFNQELFGAPTTVPWALEVYVRTPGGGPGTVPANGVCEFDTSWVKASPEVICGTYHPTFLYELLWCLGVAAILVWADRRWQLGGGRVFALYVAGYTLGRGWIEMLRIDPANHVFGLRINVLTSIVVFLGAVAFLVIKSRPQFANTREDPALLQGRHAPPAPDDTALADDDPDTTDEPPGATTDDRPAAQTDEATTTASERAAAGRPVPDDD
jgi:phosphatidylglycerol---prolipoprotein diacylglyceryl transferase